MAKKSSASSKKSSRGSSSRRSKSSRGPKSSATGRSGARSGKSSSRSASKQGGVRKGGRKPASAGAKTGGRPRTRVAQRNVNRNPDEIRLQRFLAKAGYGSRRECEELIEMGRVVIDGEVVTELGTKVNPDKHKVAVDGQRVVAERLEYFILNKPPGVVSTSKDPAGRMRVIDLIKTKSRVYNVGRLDKNSEGLILVTNDGDLANRLTHPRFGIPKTYHVQVQGEPSKETLKQLTEGIYLAEGFAKMANVKFKKRQKNTAWLEIVLEEGRNREIRRLLAKVGHKVLRLRRIAIGPLRLGELPLAAHRKLEHKEIRALRHAKAVEPVKGGKRPARASSKPRSSARDQAEKAARRDRSGKSSSSDTEFKKLPPEKMRAGASTRSTTGGRKPSRKGAKSSRGEADTRNVKGKFGSRSAGKSSAAAGKRPAAKGASKKSTSQKGFAKKSAVKKGTVKKFGRKSGGKKGAGQSGKPGGKRK